MLVCGLVALTALSVAASAEVDLDRVVFVINSQSNAHHAKMAKRTKDSVLASLRESGARDPKVLLSHEDLSNHGAWAYFSTLNQLAADYSKNHRSWKEEMLSVPYPEKMEHLPLLVYLRNEDDWNSWTDLYKAKSEETA